MASAQILHFQVLALAPIQPSGAAKKITLLRSPQARLVENGASARGSRASLFLLHLPPYGGAGSFTLVKMIFFGSPEAAGIDLNITTKSIERLACFYSRCAPITGANTRAPWIADFAIVSCSFFLAEVFWRIYWSS